MENRRLRIIFMPTQNPLDRFLTRWRSDLLSLLAQRVNDAWLRVCLREDIPGRLRRKSLKLLRMAMARLGDPLVHHDFHGYRLAMACSHNLPYYMKLAPNLMLNNQRLIRVIRQKYPTMTAIDVGANIGDSTLLFQHAGPVPTLCIEPDDQFRRYLHMNTQPLGDLVEIDASMVGDTPQAVCGRIENHQGTARLVVDESTSHTIQLRPLPDILKNHPRFSDARLLKIDTDGFDGRILRGHESWLAKVKPVVFMEYCPDYARAVDPDIFTTFATLQRVGYQGLVAYLNTGSYREAFLLNQTDQLQQLHDTFARPGCNAYVDLALFHARDLDLYEQLIHQEKSGGSIPHRAWLQAA